MSLVSGESNQTIVSAPALATQPQCFLPGTLFQRADTGQLVRVDRVRSGDQLIGPDGNATVASLENVQQLDRDVVDLQFAGGVVSVTKDHRVLILHNAQIQERAAGDLRNGGRLWTGSPSGSAFTTRFRVVSTAVFFVSFSEDLSVYIMALAKVGAKGCPGDSAFTYASAGSTPPNEAMTSRRKVHSAPPSLAPTDHHPRSRPMQVFFRNRRLDDPPVGEVLQQLARDAECEHLLEGLDLRGCKHTVSLPTDDALALKEGIHRAYEAWCASRRSSHGGRSSKLVWKPVR